MSVRLSGSFAVNWSGNDVVFGVGVAPRFLQIARRDDPEVAMSRALEVVPEARLLKERMLGPQVTRQSSTHVLSLEILMEAFAGASCAWAAAAKHAASTESEITRVVPRGMTFFQ